MTTTRKPFDPTNSPRYSNESRGLLLIGYRMPWYGDVLVFDNDGLGMMNGSGTVRRPDETLEATYRGDGSKQCYSSFGGKVIQHDGELPGQYAPSSINTDGRNLEDWFNDMEAYLRADRDIMHVRRYKP